ncbi:type II toxin-antitoxin system death-on-curing family toxin [Acerihabitans arboris]|uniref:Type II toxin-antitoxin system death-on-curing family toxin n=1 Tax=Acerihabitans arboris TaxID=2691583 RepID=A0A845SCN8_9GAMM|nr:type II toxin-antitoxin system death-on-curing family toxin [Acerihabitans arboris]NDL62530.1 type II toxin-antitoxin system death-on-curing family toxin [Acerihabitans arboris]
MMDFDFLTQEQVTEIQFLTLPLSGPPDSNKLAGALGRVEALHYYGHCNDVFKLAAMYLIGIAKAHAFNDANKRTAFQATSVFLLMNGIELNESLYLVKLTLFAAMDQANIEEITFALRLLSNYMNELLEENIDNYAE